VKYLAEQISPLDQPKVKYLAEQISPLDQPKVKYLAEQISPLDQVVRFVLFNISPLVGSLVSLVLHLKPV
jgi:hypothetical protein